MFNHYVYCVVFAEDDYLEIFEDLEEAKEDFITIMGLSSEKHVRKSIQGLWDNVKFYDNNHNQILTPTEDMLFYYEKTINNYEFDISIVEYVLFEKSELNNFKNYYCFDGYELVKKEIN